MEGESRGGKLEVARGGRRCAREECWDDLVVVQRKRWPWKLGGEGRREGV